MYRADRAVLADTKTQDAVLRVLQTLAESTQRVSDGLKVGHPEVEWRNISGSRNVIVHGYLSVDLNRISDIVEHDLPDLKAKTEAIAREIEKSP